MEEKLKAFKSDILAVCAKHKLFISHQDSQGAFLIIPEPDSKYKDILIRWFNDADLEKEDE